MKINDVLKIAPTIESKGEFVQHRGQQQTKNQMNMVEDTNTKSKVKTAVEKMNDFIDPILTDLKFVYHEELNEYYVTVIDPLTKEIIKEIPPKKMLDMYVEMAEFMGILVDERV